MMKVKIVELRMGEDIERVSTWQIAKQSAIWGTRRCQITTNITNSQGTYQYLTWGNMEATYVISIITYQVISEWK